MLRAALVLVVGSLLGGSTARAAIPSIYVGYNENCTFQLTNDAGGVVTTIAPGTYQVVIITHDPYGLTGSCNGFVQFRLTGPGVTLFTTLDYGDQTYEVDNETFQAGATYAMQDDGNAAASHLTFTVATSGSAPTVSTTTTTTTKTATKPPPAPTVKTTTGALEGLVSKAGAVSITTRDGKPVASLKSGRYTFSVHDLSTVRGFDLQLLGSSVQALTSSRYVGWRDVTVRLAPGRWTVSAGTRKKTFFVTS